MNKNINQYIPTRKYVKDKEILFFINPILFEEGGKGGGEGVGGALKVGQKCPTFRVF